MQCPCPSVGSPRRGALFLNIRTTYYTSAFSYTLKIGAILCAEKSVNIYQTTRHRIPQDINLHSYRPENFKSQIKDLSEF
jgi:hypothetical protein